MSCRGCRNLDPNVFRVNPGYILGKHVTNSTQLRASSESCRTCALIWQAVQYFAEKEECTRQLHDTAHRIHMRPGRVTEPPLTVQCLVRDVPIRLEFLTLPRSSHPLDATIPAAVVSKTPDAPACFWHIQSWLAECDGLHSGCSTPDPVPLPSRVIDVNPTAEGLEPFLLESKGMTGRYMALSYVWGSGLPLKLTNSTLGTFKAGIPWPSIPKTLQDAMTITHRLGLRYLWVDALTIVQDDEADWKIEAATMATVYSNAYLTIAATISRSCEDGILKPRTISAHHARFSLLNPRVPPEETAAHHPGEISVRSAWPNNIRDYELHKRGWAFQESILSRRIIHYTNHELLWQCRTCLARESRPVMKAVDPASEQQHTFLRPTGFPARDVADSTVIHTMSQLWIRFVQGYTQRALTYESDKLPAILGIARALQGSGMGRYHAGVWESDPLIGLAWYSAAHALGGSPSPSPTHCRPRKHRAPSWSWASVEGPVRWYLYDRGWQYLRPPLAQCHVVRLSGEELVLRGHSVAAVLQSNTCWSPPGAGEDYIGGSVSHGKLAVVGYGESVLFTDVVDNPQTHPSSDTPRGLARTPLNVLCLRLGTQSESDGTEISMALVLVPSSRRHGAYERVGICHRLLASRFDGAEDRELLII